MAEFIVEGGHQLKGSIIPQGAKNEALQIVCAVLLTSERVRISNLPHIRDVLALIDLLRAIGVEVEQHSTDTYVFCAKDIDIDYMRSDDFRKRAASLRGSIMIMGPLLSRFGKAFIPKPGGDKIGQRPLDAHFLGFQQLGASFEFDAKEIMYRVKAENLQGVDMFMTEPSVTGTANVIMTAVMAKGKTTIYNAACEPYLQQLCKMLISMGAKIQGVGSNLLTIEGVEELKGCEHRLLPDMIEIGSFIGLAAMTQSALTIKDVAYKELGQIPDTFKRLGINLRQEGDDIVIPEQESYEIQRLIDGSIPTIYDAPWPNFTPDLLSIVLVTAIQAKGSVLIHQKMFESRLFFVDKLKDMGAQITLCDPHRAVVIGMNRERNLRGIPMSSPDIRAGVALLIAALSAEGTSRISNIHQIDRGYQFIDDRLKALGANIERR